MFRKMMIGAALFSCAAALADVGIRAISNISSMQIRADESYDVVREDGTFEVVSSEDVAANNVCPYVMPGAKLQDGTYKGATSSLCSMKAHATYNGSQLVSLRLDYKGCTGDYLDATCVDNVCTGVSYSQNIRVTVIDATHYKWENLSRTDSHDEFSRIGDLMLPDLMPTSLRARSRSGQLVVGEPLP